MVGVVSDVVVEVIGVVDVIVVVVVMAVVVGVEGVVVDVVMKKVYVVVEFCCAESCSRKAKTRCEWVAPFFWCGAVV